MAILALSFGVLAMATACGHHASATVAVATTVPTVGNQGRGADVFRANCAVCHTSSGAAAGVGPLLENEKKRKTYEQTVAWIENPDPPMPKLYPAELSEKDVADVAAYVESL